MNLPMRIQLAYVEYEDCDTTYWASLRHDEGVADPDGYYVVFGVKEGHTFRESARLGPADRQTALRGFLSGPRICFEQSPAERQAESDAAIERIRQFGLPSC